MLAYRWVVALVVMALMVAPLFWATLIVLRCSLASPMRWHVPAWQRNFVLVMAGAVWLFLAYTAWAATTDWEFNTQTTIVVSAWQGAQLVIMALIAYGLWSLMRPHYAFDLKSYCRPQDMRRILALYYRVSPVKQDVTLRIAPAGGSVVLSWEGAEKRLNVRSTTEAAVLAAAFNLYPPHHEAVVIAMKGGSPTARYQEA